MTTPTRDAEQAVRISALPQSVPADDDMLMAVDCSLAEFIRKPITVAEYERMVRADERAKIAAEHIERDTVNFAAMLASERRIATLAERARLRGIVEGMQGWQPNVDGLSMVTVVHGEWLDRGDILAALDGTDV